MLVIPIQYGTASLCSGKKSEKYFYKWIVFLKHANNEDLSHIIESVSFVLHESFLNSLREEEKCPYAVLEEGWGEFDVLFRIKLKKPFQESVLEFTHFLKFQSTKSSKKPYIFKSYDEIVLQNVPQEILELHKQKQMSNQKVFLPEEHKDDEFLKLIKTINQDEPMDLTKHDEFYDNAIEFIDEEIQKIRQSTLSLDQQIKKSYEYLASKNNQLQMEKFRKFADSKTGEHPFLNINTKQNLFLKVCGLLVLPFRFLFLLHIAALHKISQGVFGQSKIFFQIESFLSSLVLIIFGVSYSLEDTDPKKSKTIYLCNYSSFIDVFLAKKIFQSQICKRSSDQQTARFYVIDTFKQLVKYAFYPQNSVHVNKEQQNDYKIVDPQQSFINFFEGLRTNNKFYAEMNNLEAFKIFSFSKQHDYNICLVKFVHHNKNFCNAQNQGFIGGVLYYLSLLGNHVYVQTQYIDTDQLKVVDTLKLFQKKLYQQDPILYNLSVQDQKYEEFLDYYQKNQQQIIVKYLQMKNLKRFFRPKLLKETFYQAQNAQNKENFVKYLDQHYFYVHLQRLYDTNISAQLRFPHNPNFQNSLDPEIYFYQKLYGQNIKVDVKELDWQSQLIMQDMDFIKSVIFSEALPKKNELTPKQIHQLQNIKSVRISEDIKYKDIIKNKNDLYYYCLTVFQESDTNNQEGNLIQDFMNFFNNLDEIDIYLIFILMQKTNQKQIYALFLQQRLQICFQFDLYSLQWIVQIGNLSSLDNHLRYFKAITENNSLMNNEQLLQLASRYYFQLLIRSNCKHQRSLMTIQDNNFNSCLQKYIEDPLHKIDISHEDEQSDLALKVFSYFQNIWSNFTKNSIAQTDSAKKFVRNYKKKYEFKIDQDSISQKQQKQSNTDLDDVMFQLFGNLPQKQIQNGFKYNISKIDLQSIFQIKIDKDVNKFFEHLVFAYVSQQTKNLNQKQNQNIERFMTELAIFIPKISQEKIKYNGHINIILNFLKQFIAIQQSLLDLKSYEIKNILYFVQVLENNKKFCHKCRQNFTEFMLVLYGKQQNNEFVNLGQLQDVLKVYYKSIFENYKDDLNDGIQKIQKLIIFNSDIDNQLKVFIQRVIEHLNNQNYSFLSDWLNLYQLKVIQSLREFDIIDKNILEELDKNYTNKFFFKQENKGAQIYFLCNQQNLTEFQKEQLLTLFDRQELLLRQGIAMKIQKRPMHIQKILQSINTEVKKHGIYNNKFFKYYIPSLKTIIFENLNQFNLQEQDMRTQFILQLAKNQNINVYDMATYKFYTQNSVNKVPISQVLRTRIQLIIKSKQVQNITKLFSCQIIF